MLDVYDALSTFDLSTESFAEILFQMKDLRKRFEKTNNLLEHEEGMEKLCNYLAKSATENARIFVTQHPVLSSFVVENEE
jgi:hypothetical protein